MAKKKRRENAWPKIKPTTKNNKAVFMVDARIGGKGERRFFDLKKDAEKWAEECRATRTNQGTNAFNGAALAEFGKTVPDAIAFYLAHLRREVASVPLSFAIGELVAAKVNANQAASYCRALQNNLETLVPLAGARKMSAITTTELDAHLATIAEPWTRNTARRDILTLWNFGAASSRKWCLASTAEDTTVAKTIDKDVEILTVEQAERLLSCCCAETLPFVVLSLFCGIRAAELAKLSWDAVRIEDELEHCRVTIGSAIAKTSARRTVPIPAVALRWLKSRVWTGAIVTPNFRNAFDRVRVRAGFLPSFTERKDATLQRLLAETKAANVELVEWPSNVLRHSAISYKLADCGDISKVATESGNSPAVILKHYLNLVASPKLAARFLALNPPKLQTVTSTPKKPDYEAARQARFDNLASELA